MAEVSEIERYKANEFANSMRGSLVIGQALMIGEKVLSNSEPSNAEDMKYLYENLFTFYMNYQNSNPNSFSRMKFCIENDKEELDGILHDVVEEATGFNPEKIESISFIDKLRISSAYLFERSEVFTIRSKAISFLLANNKESLGLKNE